MHVGYIIIEMSKKGDVRFYTEEKTSFKIQPKTVLIMSLVYIGLVVLLHIYAKLGTNKPVSVPTPSEATPEAQPDPATIEEPSPEPATETADEEM